MDHRVRYAIVVAGAAAVIALNATVAFAADVNHDKIPDSWERTYKLSLRVNQAKGDQDSDGLSNYNEWRAHTSPRVKDSDHDGKSDANEDYDHDGLSNRGEVKAHTNIRVSDTDSDGVSDAKEDPDHDGLTNAQELKTATSLLKADTDDDGVSDAKEDPDHDGLDNIEEMETSTNPRLGDSDHDGVSDDHEDYDHDGRDNEEEFIFGTNPRLGDSDGDGYEDGDEQSGIVASFDQSSGVLAVKILGSTESTVTYVVTAATEFEWAGDDESDVHPTAANLTVGAIVKEVETHVGDDGVTYASKIELHSGTVSLRGDDYEREDD